jgi:hypothetical protein
VRQRGNSSRIRHSITRSGVAACLAPLFYAGSAFAQSPPPLPPLPEAPAPPPTPAPTGTVQDVTILPPLPPPAPEPTLPAPVAPPPAIAAPAPAASPASAAPGPTATVVAAAPEAATGTVSSHGWSFGLRLDVGFPVGLLYGAPPGNQVANSLGDEFGVLLMASVDVGYRLTRHWYVGGYFSAGLGTPSSDCAGSSQCDLNDLRFGLEGKYSISPSAFVDPWLGAGLGWEIANEATDAGAGHTDGPEFFHLRAGVDFDVGHQVYLGPEAMITFGTFTDRELSNESTKLHDWITLGVGGHYDL